MTDEVHRKLGLSVRKATWENAKLLHVAVTLMTDTIHPAQGLYSTQGRVGVHHKVPPDLAE